jgi:hypothetical protein
VQGGTAESTDAAIATARAWSDKIRILSDLLVAGKTTDVLRHCATALADPSMSATRSEHCTLLLLAARAAAEEAAWSDADHFAERAERAADGNDRDVCHVLNVRATILYRRGDLDGARDLLFAAARYAESLPSPSKLLTLSNIVLLLRDMNDPSADRYERVVRTLASELSWNELRADLRL